MLMKAAALIALLFSAFMSPILVTTFLKIEAGRSVVFEKPSESGLMRGCP